MSRAADLQRSCAFQELLPYDHIIDSGWIRSLKGTYYENNTFPWGVVLGFWCSRTHTNFEKSLYMIFWVRYAFLKVSRLQLPNERVSFGAPSNVGRGHSWILLPTSPLPSNQSIAKILLTSGWAAPAGGTLRQLNSGTTIPLSAVLPPPAEASAAVQRRRKFLSPNSSQPWPRYVFTWGGSARDVRHSLYDPWYHPRRTKLLAVILDVILYKYPYIILVSSYII